MPTEGRRVPLFTLGPQLQDYVMYLIVFGILPPLYPLLHIAVLKGTGVRYQDVLTPLIGMSCSFGFFVLLGGISLSGIVAAKAGSLMRHPSLWSILLPLIMVAAYFAYFVLCVVIAQYNLEEFKIVIIY